MSTFRFLHVLVIFAVVVACRQVVPGELLTVEEPRDLEQLDSAVREQFRALWQDHGTVSSPTRDGRIWGSLGQWFDIYKYPESAERCYLNAQTLDPSEPRWPYYLGLLAEGAGDLESAEAFLSRAADLAPEEAAPKVRLADIASRRQEHDTAATLYREVLKGHPESPGALLGLGRLAIEVGDPSAAIEPLEALVAQQPEAFEVHYALGLALRQVGEEDLAAEHLGLIPEDNLDQIPLRLDAPWDVELQELDRGARTVTRRGVRAFRRHEYPLALALFERAVEADPEGPEERVNYGLALSASGQRARAREEFEEALRLADENSESAAKAHLELGRLLMSVGQFAAASRHLETTLEIDPESQAGHIELARLFHLEGKLEGALDHYATVRAMGSSLVEVRFWHAAMLVLVDRHRDAVAALTEDLEEVGGERRLELLLARVLSATRDEELRDVSRARRLLAGSSHDPDVLFAESAAMVAAADGKFDEAAAWQHAAIVAATDARPRTAVHRARRRLLLYERGEPCRTLWEIREAPLTNPVDLIDPVVSSKAADRERAGAAS